MPNEKILYFDDDQRHLDMLPRLLTITPYEIICVNASNNNPLQHEILSHDCSRPDAPCKNGVNTVISDFDFKRNDGTNGLVLLEKIRNSKCLNNSFIKLILLSAKFPDGAEFKAAIARYQIVTVDKPYTMAQILGAIQAKP